MAGLLDRLRYYQKFLLLGAIIFVSFSMTLYLLSTELNLWIEFVEKERMGVEYATTLRKLLEYTQQHRGMAAALLSGDASFRPEITAKQSQIDVAVKAVDAVDEKYGPVLKTTEQWSIVRTRLQDLKGRVWRLTPDQSFTDHTRAIEDMLSLFHRVGDMSNLTLDPELDCYRLQDAIISKIPRLCETMGQIRARGSAATAKGAVTEEERNRIVMLYGVSRSLADELSRGYQAGFEVNPNVKAKLENRVNETVGSINEFLGVVESDLVRAKPIEFDPASYFLTVTRIIDEIYKTYDATVPTLDELLAARADRLSGKRNLSWAIAAVALSTITWLFIGFSLSVVQSLSRMLDSVRRNLDGDFSAHLDISTRDEIGALGRAFNQMTGQVERLLDALDLQRMHAELIVASVPAWLLVVRKDLTVRRGNRFFQEAFGLDESAVAGKALTDLIPAQGLRETALEVLSSGKAKHGLRTEMPWKDGKRVLRVSIAGTRLPEKGEEELLVVVDDVTEEERDITERRQLQSRMMQMDSIIEVGTLAAGVAHEINNPLAYVIANLDFLARARAAPGTSLPESPAELDQALAEARDGAERVRKIVRDLKVFSRAIDARREPVSLPRVIESAVNMAWNEIRHRAKLIKDFGPTPIVLADESRLGQVFLNLLVNAAHAIPEGHADENKISIVTRTDKAGRAVVEVRDTGCGIPADVLPRIFDPFFTTKPVGQGTGLGLSICRNIVIELGGAIDVESAGGKGTVFRVALPPAPPTVASPTASPEQSAVRPTRRGRILIVDDEAAIGDAMRRNLGREHDVEAVTSGQAALDRLAADTFDVLLCDLMMPNMTGMEFFAEVNRRFPDQAPRIIFLTGGAFTPQAREFLDHLPNRKLDKPVDTQNLRAIIGEMLRQNSSDDCPED